MKRVPICKQLIQTIEKPVLFIAMLVKPTVLNISNHERCAKLLLRSNIKNKIPDIAAVTRYMRSTNLVCQFELNIVGLLYQYLLIKSFHVTKPSPPIIISSVVVYSMIGWLKYCVIPSGNKQNPALQNDDTEWKNERKRAFLSGYFSSIVGKIRIDPNSSTNAVNLITKKSVYFVSLKLLIERISLAITWVYIPKLLNMYIKDKLSVINPSPPSCIKKSIMQ